MPPSALETAADQADGKRKGLGAHVASNDGACCGVRHDAHQPELKHGLSHGIASFLCRYVPKGHGAKEVPDTCPRAALLAGAC